MSDFITLLDSVRSLHQMDIERELDLRRVVLLAFRKEEAKLAELVQDVHLRVLAGSPGYRALLGDTVEVTRSGLVTSDADFLDCSRLPETLQSIYVLKGRITMRAEVRGAWKPHESAERSVRVEGTHLGNSGYIDVSRLFMATAIETLDDLMDDTGVDPLAGVTEGDDIVLSWQQYCFRDRGNEVREAERFARHYPLLESEVLPVLREVLYEAKAHPEFAGLFGAYESVLMREGCGDRFTVMDSVTMSKGVMSLSLDSGINFHISLRDSSFGGAPTVHARAELGGPQVVMPDDHHIRLDEGVRLRHYLINLAARVAVMQKRPLTRIPQTAVPSW